MAGGGDEGPEGCDWEQYRLQVRTFLLRRFEEAKAKTCHRGEFYHRGRWVSAEALKETLRRQSQQSLHTLLEILLLFAAMLWVIYILYKSFGRYLR